MAAEGLNKHINDHCDAFLPIKKIKYHQNYLHKPSKELLKAIKKKRIIYRKFKKSQQQKKS